MGVFSLVDSQNAPPPVESWHFTTSNKSGQTPNNAALAAVKREAGCSYPVAALRFN
jgi:hypothetical protein